MKTVVLLLLLPFVIISSKLSKEENRDLQGYCGKPVPRRRSQHTKQVARSEAPWVARIDKSPRWFPGITIPIRDLLGARGTCSGTLISPRHVLTAAHCLGYFKATCNEGGTVKEGYYPSTNLGRLSVRFMESCAEGECKNVKEFKELHVEITKAFVSKSYAGFDCEEAKDYVTIGDSAVLELALDIPYSESVYPACLNENPPKKGDRLILYGYGMNGTDERPRFLRKLETTVSDCYKLKPTEDSVCDTNKIEGTCAGDSGGGKMVFDRRGTALVAATVSGGSGNCQQHLKYQKENPYQPHAFHTRVDKQLYWICAATGICANGEVSKTVEEYEERGLTNEWYHTILPRNGYDVYI